MCQLKKIKINKVLYIRFSAYITNKMSQFCGKKSRFILQSKEL